MIFVDNRETSAVIELGKSMCSTLQVTQLQVGDVVVSEHPLKDYEYGQIVIERKEVADFLSSITDGRLKKQALNMQPYPNRYIIIEGDFDTLRAKSRRYRRFSNTTIYGMIASLEMKYNVRVLQVKTNKNFWILVNRLVAKLEDDEVIEYSKTYKPKITAANKKDIPLSCVCCVPGISEKKGKLVLDNFTLYELFNISIEDLLKIKGIGKVMATNLKRVFNNGVSNTI
jgi:ERCC4-type nuclease